MYSTCLLTNWMGGGDREYERSIETRPFFSAAAREKNTKWIQCHVENTGLDKAKIMKQQDISYLLVPPCISSQNKSK